MSVPFIGLVLLRNRLAGHLDDRAAPALLHSSVHRGVIPLLVNRVTKTQPSRIVSPAISSRDSTMAFRWPFSEWKLPRSPHLRPYRPRRFQFRIASTRSADRLRGSQWLSNAYVQFASRRWIFAFLPRRRRERVSVIKPRSICVGVFFFSQKLVSSIVAYRPAIVRIGTAELKVSDTKRINNDRETILIL